MYFQNVGLRKMWLDNCLKILILEDTSRSKKETGPNTVEIWTTVPLLFLLISVKAIEKEKVSVSDKKNLKTVS